MAIVGLGVDLARIARFRKFVESHSSVLERIFCPDERDYALARHDPAQALAARFAAKEAFFKALGTGLRDGLSWQQVCVQRNELGCPSLALSGRAAEMLAQRGAKKAWLSYSHDGDYAVATVILEA
ncbi:MAG: holo-ACP synthase [Pelovirga sp.]